MQKKFLIAIKNFTYFFVKFLQYFFILATSNNFGDLSQNFPSKISSFVGDINLKIVFFINLDIFDLFQGIVKTVSFHNFLNRVCQKFDYFDLNFFPLKALLAAFWKTHQIKTICKIYSRLN
jgi:hypothetical protein